MEDYFPDAKCRGYSVELWFPPAFDEHPTGTDSEYFGVAKMVCSTCSHKKECAEVGAEEKFGVWGGVTPAERRRGIVRSPQRHMNAQALALLPLAGVRVDIKQLRQQIREVTRKLQVV